MKIRPFICVLGNFLLLAALLQVALGSRAWGRSYFESLAMFAVVAASMGPKKIRVIRLLGRSEAGWLPLGSLVTFTALIRMGIPAGVIVACLGTLIGGIGLAWAPRFYRSARAALEATAVGLTLMLARGTSVALLLHGNPPSPVTLLDLFPLLLAALVCALVTRERSHHGRENLFPTILAYLTGGGLAGIALMVLHADLPLKTVLFLLPAASLMSMTYSAHNERACEKEDHAVALQTSQIQLSDLYLSTIKSLALAIDAKDQYTHQHILRVQQYSVAVGQYMGLSGNEMEGLTTGALLHDIGKLGVPEYVLLKPGKLTPEEFDMIKKHPEIGAAILEPVEFPWPVLPVVKYHHEKWNGTGYPEGLAGEQIPLTARILAVADVYDALTSTRSYRNAWPHQRAIKLIEEEKGTHFDPAIADAFLAVIDGVVAEMAKEGKGPLAIKADPLVLSLKSDQAARDIYHSSSELWALYEVAQTLSASMGVAEIVDILARKLEVILPGTTCLFLLKSEARPHVLEVRAAIGTNRELFANAYTAGPRSLTLRMMLTRETYFGEYDHDDLMVSGSSTLPWMPLNSALIVPIIHQGESLGAINLYHQQPGAFQSQDQQLLETIAERVALALYNGFLYDRTRSHAFTDPLTDLYNLRFLTQLIQKRCEQIGREEPFAVLCLDIDNFKPVNDNFGHLRGDQVLRELALILRECIGSQDVLARYGGDEFLVILEKAGLEEAEAAAQRVRNAILNYDPGLLHVRLGALRLGVSVGYACFPADGQDCTTLISTADLRMYQDKTDRKLGLMAA